MTTALKSTGVVRNVDELGRVVIPKELRTTLNIKEKDPVEFYTTGDSIVIKKYVPSHDKTEMLETLHDLAGLFTGEEKARIEKIINYVK